MLRRIPLFGARTLPILNSLMTLKQLNWKPQYKLQEINNNNFAPTYVSQFNQRGPGEVENYVKERGLEYRLRGEYIELRYCPVCPKPHHEDFSNLYKININIRTGGFRCFRGSCSASGSWLDFKNLLNGQLTLPFQPNTRHQNEPKKNKMSEIDFHPKIEQLQQEKGRGYTYLTGTNFELGERGIEKHILTKYKVGLGNEQFIDSRNQITVECVYFPMFRKRTQSELDKIAKLQQTQRAQAELNGFPSKSIESSSEQDHYEFVKCKLRGASKDEKHFQKIIPSQAMEAIFGLNTLQSTIESLVITEGEFDAMAVHQITGLPSISLPFGARHMPDYMVKWLDEYKNLKKIYLWLDEDIAGRANASKMARKLGYERCLIVRTAFFHPDGSYPKDANDALRYNPQKIFDYLEGSKSEISQNVITYNDLKDQLHRRFLNADESTGLKCKTLPIFNKTTKGLRSGELTIITGPTGSGKTTFLSQLSLDLCEQGINTLWGSFEIKNERFLQTVMLQYAKCNLTEVVKEDEDQFQYVSGRFSDVPLYLMNFYGSTNVQVILDTIEYAIHVYGINHVCLDNLQFMLGNQEKGFKKFDFQDEVIEKFRRIATDHDIHLSLVIHPKKVDESEDLNITSVFGTAKATQEADNVFIIQNRAGYRIFDVKKNRYDGDLGRAALGFDKQIKMYFEISSNQALALEDKKIAMKDIIEDRIKNGRHFQSILHDYKPLKGGNNGGPQNGNGPANNNESNTNGQHNSVDNQKTASSANQPAIIEKQTSQSEIDLALEEYSRRIHTHLNYDEEAEDLEKLTLEAGLDFHQQSRSQNQSHSVKGIGTFQKKPTQTNRRKTPIVVPSEIEFVLDDSTHQTQLPELEQHANPEQLSNIVDDKGSIGNILNYDQKLGIKLTDEEKVSFYSDNQVRELIQYADKTRFKKS